MGYEQRVEPMRRTAFIAVLRAPLRANSVVASIDSIHPLLYVLVLFWPEIEGRIAIVTDVGWNAVDAEGTDRRAALFADGEVVWSWRPEVWR